MGRGLLAFAMALALASCAHDRPKSALGPPPRLPDPQGAIRRPPPPEWFWESIEVRDGVAPKIDLPASEPTIVRIEDGARIWDELGDEGRTRLGKDAVVVLGTENKEKNRSQIGAFYTELREARTPYVITLDALFFAVHVAFERALAEIEENRVAPDLKTLVDGLGARLAAQQKGAGIELGGGLRIARGVVGVASALLDRSVKPDPELAAEIAKIDAHDGAASSALLGATIDYARFAPPAGAARPDAFKAMTWLALAPLVLVGYGESPGARVDIGTARAHTRAAMLLARLVDREVDDTNDDAHERIAKLFSFVWGPPDDVSLREIADVASQLKVDLRNAEHVASVAKTDRVRHRATELRVPLLYDGSSAPGRAGTSVRFFGGTAPPDSALLAALGAKRLPRPIDLAIWLGAPEARASAKEDGLDLDEAYDLELARLGAAEEDPMHASVHGSILAAIASSLRTPHVTSAADRAAIESALVAWTWLRHDGRPLSRSKARTATPAKELKVGAPLPAFVEPAPKPIARLLGAVKQMQRGFAKRGPLEPTSPAATTLAEVEDLLRAALRIAEHEVTDEALSSADRDVLASLPARLAGVEEGGTSDEPAAQVVVAAEVVWDAKAKKAVTSVAGPIEPIVMLVREPSTGRLVLAVGAHVALLGADERLGDAAARERIGAASDGPKAMKRSAFVSAFRISR